MNPEGFRSGLVAVIGRPNAGKSTLVNAFMGHKVAITSDKPGTTRKALSAVINGPGYQMILEDLPGAGRPRDALSKRAVAGANQAMLEADLLLFVLDGSGPPGPQEQRLAKSAFGSGLPVLGAFNKVDLLPPAVMAQRLRAVQTLGTFSALYPVSAAYASGLEPLKQALLDRLPPGPALYPADQITDATPRETYAEIIREVVLSLTDDELPHAVGVEIEEVEEGTRLLRITANLWVERSSQKAILIGKQGQMIREIGKRARRQLETFSSHQVYLALEVRVKRNWRADERRLGELGY